MNVLSIPPRGEQSLARLDRQPPARAWKRLSFWLAGVSALLLLAGCSSTEAGNNKSKTVEVEIDYPIVDEVNDYEDFTGRTEPTEMVEIRARVTGYLDKAYFKEGATVKEGELLFEIDPRTYAAELARAEAALKQAKAHLDKLNRDYDRAMNLLPRQAISREEADKIIGDRTEAIELVGVAQANRDLTRLNLGFTRITAPISGRISRRYIDPGNLVKADDTPLTSIVSMDKMYVYFDIDERTLLKLRRLVYEGKIESLTSSAMRVQVGLADEEGFSFSGVVNFTDNHVDPSTGTLRVRATVDNPQGLLSPGMFMRVRLPVGPVHKATLVPEEAIGADQGQKFLYVVTKENKVETRIVRTGQLNNGLRVILDDVIKPEDKVIVKGLQRVRRNTEVKWKQVPNPIAGRKPSEKGSPLPSKALSSP